MRIWHLKRHLSFQTQELSLIHIYVKDRRLPDSAIGLLDMTLSAIKMVNETGKKDTEALLARLDEIEKEEKAPQEKVEELKTLLFLMHNKLSPILLGVVSDEADIHELQEYEELAAYLRSALAAILSFAEKSIEEVGIYEVAAVVASKMCIRDRVHPACCRIDRLAECLAFDGLKNVRQPVLSFLSQFVNQVLELVAQFLPHFSQPLEPELHCQREHVDGGRPAHKHRLAYGSDGGRCV